MTGYQNHLRTRLPIRTPLLQYRTNGSSAWCIRPAGSPLVAGQAACGREGECSAARRSAGMCDRGCFGEEAYGVGI